MLSCQYHSTFSHWTIPEVDQATQKLEKFNHYQTDTAHPMEQTRQKFLEPELYFIEKEIIIGEEDDEEKVKVSQLVRRGATLADFPTYPRMKKKGFQRSPLEAGENVLFAEETYSLIAAVTGYPKARIIPQEDGPNILLITIIPLIKISHDRMDANLVIHPALPNLPSLHTENIDQLINEEGVVYGLNKAALQKISDILSQKEQYFHEINIAKGVLPGEGKDAEIIFEKEIGPLAGHRMKDGTIDFRDRKVMVGVAEGEHIATKIPAVSGETGYNVLGEEIEPKTGKDIKVTVQGQVTFNPDDNRVMATTDGALSVVGKDTIKVATKITIPGDVDFSTGNIESENHAIIRGSIQPGFKVKVGGDLQIIGAISSASIECGGNAVIKGGITGTSTTIRSAGDSDIQFIERGTLESGGLVVIRKQCYYSNVSAGSDIRCHRESSILGGVVMAGGSLTVGNVGADNCDPALLAAGIDPERYSLLLQLKKELVELQEEIIQKMQLLGRGGRPKKIRQLEEAADEIKKKTLMLNLIPGTELYSRGGVPKKGQEREDVEDQDPLYYTNADIENLRIEVHGKVYAGTSLLLGNRTVTLKRDVERRRFRLSKNLKRIMAIPL